MSLTRSPSSSPHHHNWQREKLHVVCGWDARSTVDAWNCEAESSSEVSRRCQITQVSAVDAGQVYWSTSIGRRGRNNSILPVQWRLAVKREFKLCRFWLTIIIVRARSLSKKGNRHHFESSSRRASGFTYAHRAIEISHVSWSCSLAPTLCVQDCAHAEPRRRGLRKLSVLTAWLRFKSQMGQSKPTASSNNLLHKEYPSQLCFGAQDPHVCRLAWSLSKAKCFLLWLHVPKLRARRSRQERTTSNHTVNVLPEEWVVPTERLQLQHEQIEGGDGKDDCVPRVLCHAQLHCRMQLLWQNSQGW